MTTQSLHQLARGVVTVSHARGQPPRKLTPPRARVPPPQSPVPSQSRVDGPLGSSPRQPPGGQWTGSGSITWPRGSGAPEARTAPLTRAPRGRTPGLCTERPGDRQPEEGDSNSSLLRAPSLQPWAGGRPWGGPVYHFSPYVPAYLPSRFPSAAPSPAARLSHHRRFQLASRSSHRPTGHKRVQAAVNGPAAQV